MRNPFTSGLGGGDKPSYRDDPANFGQSSDTAQGKSSSRMAGGGVEQGPDEGGTSSTGESGSPADFDPGERDEADGDGEPATSDAASTDPDAGDEVKSRSADPGQSSYGGFRNEGTSPENQGSSDRDESQGGS